MEPIEEAAKRSPISCVEEVLVIFVTLLCYSSYVGVISDVLLYVLQKCRINVTFRLFLIKKINIKFSVLLRLQDQGVSADDIALLSRYEC